MTGDRKYELGQLDPLLNDMAAFSDDDSFPQDFLSAPGLSFDDIAHLKHHNTSETDHDMSDEKKQERLERNREIARKCRKRKRERIDALTEEVSKLRETNRNLEIQLKICQSKLGQTTSGRGNRGLEEENRRLAEVKRMAEMVTQRFTEEEIAERLVNYTEVYSDFGEERSKVVKTHLQQLERLLLPTQISKMLLWILEQNDEFFYSKDKSSIWNTLVEEVGLDDAQKQIFLAQRSKLGSQNKGMKTILKKLKDLEGDIDSSMVLRRKQVTEITKEITPSQQAKFLNWVEKNQACIHLLDNLWKQRAKDVIVKNES